jgi:hypothetical protein
MGFVAVSAPRAHLPLKGGGRMHWLRVAKLMQPGGGRHRLRKFDLDALLRDPHPNPPPFRGREHTEIAALLCVNRNGIRSSMRCP